MKRALTVVIIISFAVFFTQHESAARSVKNDGSGFLSSLPEVKKTEFENGVKILYLEDELPVTVIYASVSFGRMYEKSSDAGITEVLCNALMIGGTAKYPGGNLSRVIEDTGGEIHISAGWETIGIEIKVLSRYNELAFEVLADILKNPLFDEKSAGSARQLVAEKMKRNMDEPEENGVLKLREIIFGGSGYGAVPTEKSISSVDTAALNSLWKRFSSGSNITIAVSSSADEKDISLLAEKNLKGMVKGAGEHYTVDKSRILSDLKTTSGNIYLIPMELEQATIYTGTYAPDISYSGNYALYLMNYILGGGSFNSRLMNDIRVKRGLAYSVYSLVRNRRNAGVFISFVQTKNESVSQVLALMRGNISGMYTSLVGKDELQWARESVNNSYVFRFNDIDDLLSNYLEMEYNNLGENYYRDYPANIMKVTADDISEESRKLFSQGLVTVVVGSRNLENELSQFGKVIICEQER